MTIDDLNLTMFNKLKEGGYVIENLVKVDNLIIEEAN